MNGLILKSLNNPICEIAKLKYKGISVPKGAVSYDFVSLKNKTGRQFDILTFKTEGNVGGFGSVIKKYIFEKFKWGNSVTEQDFVDIEQKSEELSSTESKSKTKARKIISVRKFEGKVVKKTETTQAVTSVEGAAPILHISTIETEPIKDGFEKERQSLFRFRKGEESKGYEVLTTAKSPFGYMLGVIPLNFKFKNISQVMQENFKKDKYLLLHLYPFSEFKKMAPTISEDSSRPVRFSCGVEWFEDDDLTKKGRLIGDTKNINRKTVYLNEKAIKGRYETVAKSAHEREHAYQFEQVVALQKQKEAQDNYVMNPTDENLEIYRTLVEKMPVKNKEEARRYQLGFQNYVDSSFDADDYLDQEVERLSKRAELVALKEYRKSIHNLKSEFPDAPDFIIAGGEEAPMVLGDIDPIEYMRLMRD